MEPNDQRNYVLDMLIRTLEKGELSNQVLRASYEDPALSVKELAFRKRLYTGTLEKRVYLDYLINAFSRLPVENMKPVIRNILRLSLYQMLFMDAVPVPASINEGVKLTRRRGFAGLTGFVNGILRRIDREADKVPLPEHVRACAPLWLYELVARQYGKEQADAFFQSVQTPEEDVRIRLCCLKEDPEQILHMLQEDGCQVRKLEQVDQGYAIQGFRRLPSLKAFQKGYLMVQDPSSVLAAQTACLLEPDPSCVLDVCAAPGGKCLYIAEKCPDARVIARDISAVKTGRILENAERLGIRNLEVQIRDARIPDPAMKEQADLVICDLPCSGLGVIGRKPDILSRLKQEDLSSLALLQREILQVSQQYVRPGGTLVYSTCTINQTENEENADWFAAQSGYRKIYEKQFLPGRDPYDGFYIAGFRKPGP